MAAGQWNGPTATTTYKKPGDCAPKRDDASRVGQAVSTATEGSPLIYRSSGHIPANAPTPNCGDGCSKNFLFQAPRTPNNCWSEPRFAHTLSCMRCVKEKGQAHGRLFVGLKKIKKRLAEGGHPAEVLAGKRSHYPRERYTKLFRGMKKSENGRTRKMERGRVFKPIRRRKNEKAFEGWASTARRFPGKKPVHDAKENTGGAQGRGANPSTRTPGTISSGGTETRDHLCARNRTLAARRGGFAFSAPACFARMSAGRRIGEVMGQQMRA